MKDPYAGMEEYYKEQDKKFAKDLAVGRKLTAKYRKPPKKKSVAVAELGETYLSLAEKYSIDPVMLSDANDGATVHAGDAVNIPDTTVRFGGLTEEEQYWQDTLAVPANYIDFLTHQETLNVSGVNKFGGRTAQPTEEGIVYPEGWNPQEFKMFGENTKDTGFWEQYRNLDMSKKSLFEKGAPTYGMTNQEVDPRYQSYTPNELAEMGYGYLPDDMIETGGIPSYHKWEQDASGQWEAKPPEAVFDALYEMNGIDPNDPDMVEWFWGFADDDLLYMGEFFDVLDYPSSDGGGYGGYAAPSYESKGYSGQRPQRGNYASYLQLSSWSI